MISEAKIQNILATVEMLKVVQKLPEGAELPSQDLFIDWYLSNNDYELTAVNPAHKPPAYHLMKTLVDQVLNLLKTSSPSKVLSKYTEIMRGIKESKRFSSVKKHLLFNQLHHGASNLLSSTLTPGSLSEVLVGGDNPLLSTIVNELKFNLLKKSSSGSRKNWNPERQTDITEQFEPVNLSEVKDIQAGRGGSKNPACKIPVTQKTIELTSNNNQWPNRFIIGFCLNDHSDKKTAILPTKVQLYGGMDKTLLKIGELQLI